MKKKSLFVVALALVIVGSMLAGTMAQYVKEANLGNIAPDFKDFKFSAQNTTADATMNLKMAPGETKFWTFNLSNKDEAISEANMIVTLNLRSANVPSGMEIYVNGSLVAVGAEEKSFPVAAFEGGVLGQSPVVVVAKWVSKSDGEDNGFINKTDAVINVKFIATSTAEFLPLKTLTAVKDGTGVIVSFNAPEEIDLSKSTSNIAIEYFGDNGYVVKKDGNPLIKTKSWSSYLCGPTDSAAAPERYSLTNIPDTTYGPYTSDLIPSGLKLTNATYDRSWFSTAAFNVPGLKVAVTINVDGKVYRSVVPVN